MMETVVYSPLPKDAHTRDTWQVDAEAPELVTDSTGTTLAIMAVTFKGSKEEQKAEQLANGRRVVAAVNAFKGVPNAAIEKITSTATVARLVALLQAAQHFVPNDSGSKPGWSDENLWVAIENAIKGFRSVGFDHAPYVQPTFERGQRVLVNHPRYHGEGFVQYDTGNRKRMVGVLLENGNTWEYEAETVELANLQVVNVEPFPVTQAVFDEYIQVPLEGEESKTPTWPNDNPNLTVEALKQKESRYDFHAKYLGEWPAKEDTAEIPQPTSAQTLALPEEVQTLNNQIAIGLGISPKLLWVDPRVHPDIGLDLTEKAPRIYKQWCDQFGGHITSDEGFSCTPEKCINQSTISEIA